MREATVDRAPGLSVRLKLTLSYAGFLMLTGALLLAAVWLFLLRYVPDRALIVIAPWHPRHGVVPDPLQPPARFRSERQPKCWRSCWCSVCWEGGFSPAECSPP